MKSTFIPSILSVFLIACVCSSLGAQKRAFYPGYIITHSGDTIPGRIKDRSPECFVSLYQKIRFKREGKSRTQKYGPEDILGYGYQGKHFISMPFREESTLFRFRYLSDGAAQPQFLKVIAQSPGLWYLEQPYVDDDSSYLDFVPFFYRPGSSELVRVTQGIFGLKRKRLATYFQDCPAVLQEMTKARSTLKTVWELYDFYINHCYSGR